MVSLPPLCFRVELAASSRRKEPSRPASGRPALFGFSFQDMPHKPGGGLSRRASSMSGGISDDVLAHPGSGSGDGSGVGDAGGSGGGGRGDGEGGDVGDGEDRGALLSWAAVQKILSERNLSLPADMAEFAQKEGLFSVFLERFIQLQSAVWPVKPLIKFSVGLRNRLLADPSFLFKVLAEVLIDSGCATFAEVQKRGKDFWKEFDLYASDMLVGIVMDVALVSMLAPVARFSLSSASPAGRPQSAFQGFLTRLPSSMFEASVPGRSYSAVQRLATWFVKATEYGVVGFSCGLVGQGIANGIIDLKKSLKKNAGDEHEEEEVKTPPLLKTACLWGGFMAISSNTRYQVVNGLEAIVDASPAARRFPLISQGFTLAIRFGNNIFGGMQFVDWARWSGVQ